ncbi:MAG: hypothetical protein AAF268_03255 [Cyanobacteria bacterium P01_A01_bin.3]
MSQPTRLATDSPQVADASSSANSNAESLPLSEEVPSGGEYDKFKRQLLVTTLICCAVIAFTMAWFYPTNVVMNYAIGSIVGLVYLRMLGRGVARLGPSSRSTGSGARLALFAALIIVATRVESLEILPIFFGFMTYKAALFVYAFQTLVPTRKS